MRQGDWIQTYKGLQFWPLDPRPEEIDIEDIGHALSMLCRFGGHCLNYYSVAEHSVFISHLVPKEDALWGLLHDAAEAYLVDLPRPLKRCLSGYKVIEDRLLKSIQNRFHLDEIPSSVKIADLRMLSTEASQNMSTPPKQWQEAAEPFQIELNYWNPKQAKFEFLKRFKELAN